MRKKKNREDKWVICLNCDNEYFIESFEPYPCCPVCESQEYDDVDHHGEDLF